MFLPDYYGNPEKIYTFNEMSDDNHYKIDARECFVFPLTVLENSGYFLKIAAPNWRLLQKEGYLPREMKHFAPKLYMNLIFWLSRDPLDKPFAWRYREYTPAKQIYFNNINKNGTSWIISNERNIPKTAQYKYEIMNGNYYINIFNIDHGNNLYFQFIKEFYS